jgi:hypothetical protein
VFILSQYSDGLRVRIQAEARLLHNVETGSGAQYPIGTGGDLPGGKAAWREAVHSYPSSSEIKNDGAEPPLLHIFSWHGA